MSTGGAVGVPIGVEVTDCVVALQAEWPAGTGIVAVYVWLKPGTLNIAVEEPVNGPPVPVTVTGTPPLTTLAEAQEGVLLPAAGGTRLTITLIRGFIGEQGVNAPAGLV